MDELIWGWLGNLWFLQVKDNSPLHPPDGLIWHCISINDGRHIYVDDKTNPDCGLNFARVNNVLRFIQLPHSMLLSIVGNCGLRKIYNALEACKKLRKISLVRSDRKRVFGDYGKPVKYTCAGVQVSPNSRDVVDFVPYMDKLATCHWEALIWIMRRARCMWDLGSLSLLLSLDLSLRKSRPFSDK